MQFTGFLTESLKIDALKTKWVVRILFVMLIFLFVFPKVYTIGDADFSAVYSFLERYMQEETVDVEQVQLPALTVGNLVHVSVVFIFEIFRFLILFFYAGLFINDFNFQKPGKIVWMTLRKMPVIILLVALLIVPFLIIIMMMIPIPLLLFIVPALYIAPILIFDRKKPMLDALLESVKLTRGFKLSIFLNLITLVSIQWLGRFVFSYIINFDSIGFILVSGFIYAFIYLAIARNMTLIYRLITSPVAK